MIIWYYHIEAGRLNKRLKSGAGRGFQNLKNKECKLNATRAEKKKKQCDEKVSVVHKAWSHSCVGRGSYTGL